MPAFAGTAREIMVPVDRVIAIYARENGQGMAFPQPVAAGQTRPTLGQCQYARCAARRHAAHGQATARCQVA